MNPNAQEYAEASPKDFSEKNTLTKLLNRSASVAGILTALVLTLAERDQDAQSTPDRFPEGEQDFRADSPPQLSRELNATVGLMLNVQEQSANLGTLLESSSSVVRTVNEKLDDVSSSRSTEIAGLDFARASSFNSLFNLQQDNAAKAVEAVYSSFAAEMVPLIGEPKTDLIFGQELAKAKLNSARNFIDPTGCSQDIQSAYDKVVCMIDDTKLDTPQGVALSSLKFPTTIPAPRIEKKSTEAVMYPNHKHLQGVRNQGPITEDQVIMEALDLSGDAYNFLREGSADLPVDVMGHLLAAGKFAGSVVVLKYTLPASMAAKAIVAVGLAINVEGFLDSDELNKDAKFYLDLADDLDGKVSEESKRAGEERERSDDGNTDGYSSSSGHSYQSGSSSVRSGCAAAISGLMG